MKQWIREHLCADKGPDANRCQLKWFLAHGYEKVYKEILESTSFIENVHSFSERIYCIEHDFTEPPKCILCGKPVRWRKYSLGYHTYCSNKCVGQSPIAKEKFKKTCLKNLGVEHPMYSVEVREKSKKTCMENWGVENSLSSPIIKAKIEKTVLKKYKVRKIGQSKEIHERAKQTNLRERGVENVFAAIDVKELIQQRCLNKNGVKHSSQIGMPLESLRLLSDKDWLYHRHVVEQIPLYVISKELGVSESLSHKYAAKHGIKVQRFAKSFGEMEIAEFLEEESIISNNREVIAPQEIDVFLPDHMLGIEFDGIFWHALRKQKDFHLKKTNRCEDLGIQLFHIFEDEWESPVKRNIWKSLINGKIGKNRVVETTKVKFVNETKEFLENNHLEGYIKSKVNLGLFQEEELVSLACFSDNKLLRYCDKVGVSVKNSFEILLKVYGKDIVYLANRRWNYFPNCECTEPNCFYFEVNESVLYPENVFGEEKHMEIWDCGDAIFLWKIKW
jgi:hypothetical protein